MWWKIEFRIKAITRGYIRYVTFFVYFLTSYVLFWGRYGAFSKIQHPILKISFILNF